MMKEKKERPGIILYFDMATPLKRLNYEDKGKILEAMLEYGQYGVVPELDGILLIVWDCIQPRLDADEKRYRKTVLQKTHASYCAKEKRAGRTPLELDDWCEKECIDTTTWCRMEPCDAMRHPNEKETINTISNIETDEKSTTAGIVKREGKAGVESLSEDEETMRQRKIAMLNNYLPN